MFPVQDAQNPPLSGLLASHPTALIAENDKHRRSDVQEGSGLYSMANLAEASTNGSYTFMVPTFTPKIWQTHDLPVNDTDYATRFHSKFSECHDMLTKVNVAPAPIKVVAAGGAAAWPLGDRTIEPSDVDFFFCGQGTTKDFWHRAADVVESLTDNLITEATCVTQELRPGLITLIALYLKEDSMVTKKFQLILRQYQSVSALLHSFDVASCAVAFDGKEFYSTAIAAYAHAHRINVVNPAYRSPSFEHRLAKYFERGYALALLNLDASRLIRNTQIELPHMKLHIDVVHSNYAAGTIELATRSQSDYEPSMKNGRRRHILHKLIGRVQWGLARMNLRAFTTSVWADATPYDIGGIPAFGVIGYVSQYKDRAEVLADGWNGRWLIGLEPNRPLPLRKWAEESPPCFHEVLPRDYMLHSITNMAKTPIYPQRINTSILSEIFGLSHTDMAALTRNAIAMRRGSHGAPLILNMALKPRIDALRRRWNSQEHYTIDWWRTAPVGLANTFTSSLRPCAESALEWYGAAYVAECVSPPLQVIVKILNQLRRRSTQSKDPVYDGQCALCFDPLSRGEANSTILGCGHIFHWASNENGCGGLIQWVSDHDGCPTCRTPFDTEAPWPREVAIELPVDLASFTTRK